MVVGLCWIGHCPSVQSEPSQSQTRVRRDAIPVAGCTSHERVTKRGRSRAFPTADSTLLYTRTFSPFLSPLLPSITPFTNHGLLAPSHAFFSLLLPSYALTARKVSDCLWRPGKRARKSEPQTGLYPVVGSHRVTTWGARQQKSRFACRERIYGSRIRPPLMPGGVPNLKDHDRCTCQK